MADAYSQDLRDRVIEAVTREGMSRWGAAARFGLSESSAIKWLERFERTGERTAARMGGYKPVKLEPHRALIEALWAKKPDTTLQALCGALLADCGISSDTSLMSRFLRRLGLTPKKRRSSRANKTALTSRATGRGGASAKGASTPPGSSSSTRPGPRPT